MSVLFRYCSDLHISSPDLFKVQSGDDDSNTVMIIAGDFVTEKSSTSTTVLVQVLQKLSNQFRHVVVVLGNHDYWYRDFETAVYWYRTAASQFHNVTILDCDTIQFDDVIVLGCTMWTDFDRGDPLTMFYSNQQNSGLFQGMKDYKFIRTGGTAAPRSRKLTPSMVYDTHKIHKKWLSDVLVNFTTNKTIVVTHHAPSTKSLMVDDSLNGCYASDLSDIMIDGQPNYWIHGHTHCTVDYMIDNTRVLCQARGYDPYGLVSNFDEVAGFVL